VCGLGLARRALPRPLLFQASSLQAKPVQESRKAAISAPALGRVDPVAMAEPDPQVVPVPAESLRSAPILADSARSVLAGEAAQDASAESFWPLVRLEATEAGVLLGLNLVVALGASWLAGVGLAPFYGELWHFLVPVHFAISWAFEMVPITLVGQSPLMGSLGLLLDSVQPERRIAFSLFHLISVVLFPVSFFCMVLTPYHRTLAEILTGQEILARPLPRMK